VEAMMDRDVAQYMRRWMRRALLTEGDTVRHFTQEEIDAEYPEPPKRRRAARRRKRPADVLKQIGSAGGCSGCLRMLERLPAQRAHDGDVLVSHAGRTAGRSCIWAYWEGT
jgi:hypothetical protein